MSLGVDTNRTFYIDKALTENRKTTVHAIPDITVFEVMSKAKARKTNRIDVTVAIEKSAPSATPSTVSIINILVCLDVVKDTAKNGGIITLK